MIPQTPRPPSHGMSGGLPPRPAAYPDRDKAAAMMEPWMEMIEAQLDALLKRPEFLKKLIAVNGSYYKGLCDNGLTPDQAFELVKAHGLTIFQILYPS